MKQSELENKKEQTEKVLSEIGKIRDEVKKLTEKINENMHLAEDGTAKREWKKLLDYGNAELFRIDADILKVETLLSLTEDAIEKEALLSEYKKIIKK